MEYYLKHYFDPDFDYLNRKPGSNEENDGSDLYSLGYVQNVIAGQLLAETMPLPMAGKNPDPRFIQEKPGLPAGQNTYVDPKYPNYLLAAQNGYVFYLDGKITVKGLLNVRQDVSFNTGNIFFVGDMAVHGAVRAGFNVQANNLKIMGPVDGGVARSRRDMMVEGGARGGVSHNCLLDVGGELLTSKLEKVEARVRGNMVVNQYCLYSTVYAGANMVVREHLYGSTINAYGSVYVGKQLGNKAGVPTKVYLGYDPLSIRQLEKIDELVASVSQTITHLNAVAGHLPPDINETTRKLARMRIQHEAIISRRTELWDRLYKDESFMNNCRLLVPGMVYAGVEVSIGRTFMVVKENCRNVSFRLFEDDILVEPMPAGHKGKL